MSATTQAMTLANAESLLQAAKAKGSAIGVSASIVVLDAAAHLKAFCRMDGAWLGSIDVAVRKARTSVLFEMNTETVWEIGNPQGQAHGIEATNGGLVTFAGGVPLKDPAGQILGSVGVSGGLVAQDAEIAQAALSAWTKGAQ